MHSLAVFNTDRKACHSKAEENFFGHCNPLLQALAFQPSAFDKSSSHRWFVIDVLKNGHVEAQRSVDSKLTRDGDGERRESVLQHHVRMVEGRREQNGIRESAERDDFVLKKHASYYKQQCTWL